MNRRWAGGDREAGRPRIELRIANTMANAREGIQSPSGLMGPLHLIVRTYL